MPLLSLPFSDGLGEALVELEDALAEALALADASPPHAGVWAEASAAASWASYFVFGG
jgi:hypothetical protein